MHNPITITFDQARAAGACSDGAARMRDHLGADWPDDRPFPLVTVLDVSGLDDALWGLDVVDEAAARLVASDFAARVAHLSPDTRVAAAIRAARGHAHGRVTRQKLAAAARSAYDAHSDAAARAAAAFAAARTTAWAASAARTAAAATDAHSDAAAAADAGATARAAADAAFAADAAARAHSDTAARAAADATDADGDAERAWQVAHLRAVLTGKKQPGRIRIRKVAA